MGGYRRPESVLVLIYVDRSRILLLKRIRPFAFWQSVTGSLDEDETPEETARRELLEETGLEFEGELIDTDTCRVFTIDPRWRDRFAPGTEENIEHEFRYRLPVASDIRLDTTEHSCYRWVDIDNAVDLVWSWTNKAALERLKDEL